MIAIAIDGPAGAGKSTIAKKISAELGYVYVDTGALYRAIGLYAIRSGVPEQTEQYVVPLLPEIRVELKFIDHMQRVFLNAEDVSEAISQNEVSMAASNVSAIPAVREFLFAYSNKSHGKITSLWTAETSERWYCPMRILKFSSLPLRRIALSAVILSYCKKDKRWILTRFCRKSSSGIIMILPVPLLRSKKQRTPLQWTPPETLWKSPLRCSPT